MHIQVKLKISSLSNFNFIHLHKKEIKKWVVVNINSDGLFFFVGD